MSTDPKVYILLPAYNEEKALAELIPSIGTVLRVESIPYHICVVDDGSGDQTTQLIRTLSQEWPITYLRHEKNLGYGGALNTGFSWIIQQAQGSDIALSLDADNTHSPIYFPPMVRKIHDGFDVVTASYTMPGGKAIGVPPKRRVFSLVANLLFRILFRIPGTRAYTTGFRAYRISALQRTYKRYGSHIIEERGFPGGTELLIKVFRAGPIRTVEIPFILHYDRRGGNSKIRVMQTIRCYLQLIGRFARPSPARLSTKDSIN